mgnify:CR=1 FL=1|jgi:3-oxoacyl-[acyl-carrier-protein] synthase II
MKRVVITGTGAISALGNDWDTASRALAEGRNKVQVFPEWQSIHGLRTRLGAPVTDFTIPPTYPRKQLRSMGRGSVMAVRATEMALEQAGLLNSPLLKSGRTGVSYGSCIGSPGDVPSLAKVLTEHTTVEINASTYVKTMSHTAAVNIGVFFSLTGRIIPTASACTSGSQGIGYAYEAIKYGLQDIMVAGGAEEFSVTQVAVFDTLFATSLCNDRPHLAPRPFDKDRDGLVIGEGACTLILEEYEHARARGATILGEVVGFATNSDGTHITDPRSETMAEAMGQALADARLGPEQITYVNAHGTATTKGDIAESQATARILGRKPISSLKSYVGHTLGACGALEAWLALEMLRHDWYAPTLNLINPDPECGDLDYIMGEGRRIQGEYVMSNNFAFGGINTSLILKRH